MDDLKIFFEHCILKSTGILLNADYVHLIFSTEQLNLLGEEKSEAIIKLKRLYSRLHELKLQPNAEKNKELIEQQIMI